MEMHFLILKKFQQYPVITLGCIRVLNRKRQVGKLMLLLPVLKLLSGLNISVAALNDLCSPEEETSSSPGSYKGEKTSGLGEGDQQKHS